MNKLQTFMARADIQDQPNKQEQFECNGSLFYATIDRAVPNVDMLRQGYNEWATATLTCGAAQFTSAPQARQNVTRLQTNKIYFIQKADTDDPVLWTLDLVDREPNNG